MSATTDPHPVQADAERSAPVASSDSVLTEASLPERADRIAAELKALSCTATFAATKRLSRSERRAMFSSMDGAISQLQAVRSRLVTAEDASGDWISDGDKSFESWLARTTKSGYGPAKNDADMARTLDDLPALDQALEDGDVTIEHVKTASKHYSRASDSQRDSLNSPDAQDALVEKAKHTDAGRFGKQLAKDLARVDTQQLERDREAVRRRRTLTLSPYAGGFKIDGFVDPVSGEYLRTALDAANPRPAADDTRTSAQRRADALATLAKSALDTGSLKPGGAMRPHVMMTLSAAEWADWHRCGHDPAQAPIATIGDDIPLAPSEAATLLCDCTIMRAVLDPDGNPIDLGRDKRTFTTHLRKALQLRDGHCAWPGCAMPGRYTEGHHIDEWAEHGPTSVANGLLICSYHHHQIHAKKIQLDPVQGGIRFTAADGRLIGTHTFKRTDPPPDWATGPPTTEKPPPPGGNSSGGSAPLERNAPGANAPGANAPPGSCLTPLPLE